MKDGRRRSNTRSTTYAGLDPISKCSRGRLSAGFFRFRDSDASPRSTCSIWGIQLPQLEMYSHLVGFVQEGNLLLQMHVLFCARLEESFNSYGSEIFAPSGVDLVLIFLDPLLVE